MKALRQAIDYSECILETDLDGADNLFYKRLRYVFLYPSPFNFYHAGLSGEYGHDWGMGAIRLAGKFGVGVIQPDCGFHNTSCFLLSGEPAYWLGRGPTGMRHEINKRFGSAV
jgi:hypothetical protein